MYKSLRVVLFLALSLIAPFGYAASNACPAAPEKPSTEMLQAAARNARDHGFMWRISKDGHTSYLYGTMHVGKLDWAIPGPAMMQALRATDTVALELDNLDPDIQSRLMAGMATLQSTELPAPLAQRLRQQADALCIPYTALAMLAPELQVTELTMMIGRREGLDASYAMDGVLAGIGHRTRKNMVSLETPEMQLKLLQMENPQDTAAFVQDNLEELESGHALSFLVRIAKVWANADYAEMEHFNEWCECLKTEIEREEMKRLLDDRNPDMAQHIDELHQSGKQVFAAVGSLHMFGPLGLPVLMAKRGYRVERVDFKTK